VRKALVALAGVMIGVGLLALCLISAQQLLIARQTPLGVVGPSIVVQGAQTKVGLDPVFYRSKSAALAAIDQGQLYGAYVRELVEQFCGAVTGHIAKSDREMVARRIASGLRTYFGWEEHGVASRWQHEREAQLLKTTAAGTAVDRSAADEQEA